MWLDTGYKFERKNLGYWNSLIFISQHDFTKSFPDGRYSNSLCFTRNLEYIFACLTSSRHHLIWNHQIWHSRFWSVIFSTTTWTKNGWEYHLYIITNSRYFFFKISYDYKYPQVTGSNQVRGRNSFHFEKKKSIFHRINHVESLLC